MYNIYIYTHMQLKELEENHSEYSNHVESVACLFCLLVPLGLLSHLAPPQCICSKWKCSVEGNRRRFVEGCHHPFRFMHVSRVKFP